MVLNFCGLSSKQTAKLTACYLKKIGVTSKADINHNSYEIAEELWPKGKFLKKHPIRLIAIVEGITIPNLKARCAPTAVVPMAEHSIVAYLFLV